MQNKTSLTRLHKSSYTPSGRVQVPLSQDDLTLLYSVFPEYGLAIGVCSLLIQTLLTTLRNEGITDLSSRVRNGQIVNLEQIRTLAQAGGVSYADSLRGGDKEPTN